MSRNVGVPPHEDSVNDPDGRSALHEDERRELAESNRLFGLFSRVWAPALGVLILVEAIVLPPAQRGSLVMATVATVGAVVLSALSFRRVSAFRLLILVAVLLDAVAIMTAATTASGNDAAIFLPFLGSVLLMPFLEGRRLALAFSSAWLVGMIAAAIAYGLGPLSTMPDAEPFVVNAGAAALQTGIGYALLWWARDRLTGALRAAHAAEVRAHVAEREARRREHAMEALIASSPVPTFSLDRSAIRTWNTAASRLLGWTAEEMVGRPWQMLVADDEIDATESRIGRALAGEVVAGERTRWRRRDGSSALVEMYLAIEEATGEGPACVVGQLIDLAEREALQGRMAEIARLEAVGQLAGGIAHDFNNLLTGITGYAELLHDDVGLDGQRRRDVREILLAGRRGANLVRQLLTFSRRQPFAPTVVDFGGLVVSLEPMLRRLIGAEVAIEIAPIPGSLHVSADPAQLEQVVMNLVVNARDAMASGGRLAIRLASTEVCPAESERSMVLQPGPHVEMTVSDTGHGMDQATLARIFEPFFTTKSAGNGTGLGLATTYGIVRASGGEIWAVSAPGAGTTFHVLLPRVSAPAGALEPVAADPAPEGGRETVLVVDDEPAVREFVRRALERLGYRVLVADGPAQALERADDGAGHIDLVVTDVVMPEMRGPALAERLRAARPEIRTLYMSGYAADRAVAPGEPPMGDAFLPKPFRAADLAHAVRDILDRRAGTGASIGRS